MTRALMTTVIILIGSGPTFAYGTAPEATLPDMSQPATADACVLALTPGLTALLKVSQSAVKSC